jgi:LPXTG-motif cell wall-anchored protein
MPTTGGGEGTFFFVLLAFTGLALLMVGLMSRRPAKR